MKKLIGAMLAALLAWVCMPASAMEVNGVTVEPVITVAGTQLELNGAGVRYKGFVKVNVAEIHATKKFNSLEELMALPGPKRATLTMLREVPSDLLAKSMTRGIEDNFPKTQMSKLVPSLIRVSDIFNAHKVLATGDKVQIDWIPEVGTVFTVKGKAQGDPFKDAEFFRAIMSAWLGPVPADFKLKDALLGVK